MSETLTPETDKEQADQSAPQNNAPRRKTRLTKTLPTDRIPFRKQVEVIPAIPVAFNKDNGPITFKEVGSLLGMAEATLLQMSGFLTDVGLISRGEGGKITPCSELLEFERIRSFSLEKAWLKLSPVFEKCWFGLELIPRLRLREMSEEDAIHALAEVSMADKDHQEQLEIAIAYLEKVGILSRDGGSLRLKLESSNAPKTEEVEKATEPSVQPVATKANDPEEMQISGLERHSLTLDPKVGRKIVIFAPPTMKTKELERLQQWLGFQFIIDDEMTT